MGSVEVVDALKIQDLENGKKFKIFTNFLTYLQSRGCCSVDVLVEAAPEAEALALAEVEAEGR